jgi:cytochrome c-type biogenesis protein CcmH/NrfG
MEQDQVYQRIETYLGGQMTDEERRAFESEISQNPELASEVAFYLHAREALTQTALESRRAELLALLPEEGSGAAPRTRTLSMRWALGLAASVALLVGFAVWAFLSGPEPTLNQMADGFATEKMGGSTTMGGGPSTLQTGLDHFNNGQLAEARDAFALYLQNTPNDPVALEGLARSYLGLGEFRLALDRLEDLETLGGPYNSAKFFKALVLIRRNAPGDQAQARELLQSIVSAKGGHYRDAEKLLEKM